jgi:hypothetical protein
LLLFALGWFGFQPDVEKWIGSSYNLISEAVRGFLVPTSEPPPSDSALPVGPAKLSTNPKPEGSTDERDLRAPQQRGIESSFTGGKHN